jgi:hypothetical protein
MLKLSVARAWYFVVCVVGEECPTSNVGFFFADSLLRYAMNLKVEDLKLKLRFRDQFKEYDERI